MAAPLYHELHEHRHFSSKVAFWLIAYGLAVVLLGSNLPTPLYVLYQNQWHFSAGILTVIFTVYILGVIVSLLFAGRLSDQIGRQRVLIPTVLLSLAGSVLFLFEQGVSWLLVARLLQGLATGAFVSTATAKLIDIEPRGNTHYATLIGSAATAIGLALGPLLAGVLTQYAPYPMQLVYIVHIILLVPVILSVWNLPEACLQWPAKVCWGLQPIGIPTVIRTFFIQATGTFSLGWMVTALFLSLGPSFVVIVLHIHYQALSGGVICLFFSISAGIQLMLRSITRKRAMIGGLFALTLGIPLVGCSLLLQSIALFLLGTVLTGIGQGLSFMGSLALVNGIAPSTRRGEIIAAFYSILIQ